jgi:hypothetical protein
VQKIHLNKLDVRYVARIGMNDSVIQSLVARFASLELSSTCNVPRLDFACPSEEDTVRIISFARMERWLVHLKRGQVVLSTREDSPSDCQLKLSGGDATVKVNRLGPGSNIMTTTGSVYALNPGMGCTFLTNSGTVTLIHPGPSCSVTTGRGDLKGHGSHKVAFESTHGKNVYKMD